mmetsp:Transcript_9482/g.26597  ORF Transcript_9482/g.26597 Transcript_9482/m.26597 type:complete len:171 (+) Transcript_9482:35-547(+)|eukprot:CAMPEP_0119124098 /NCGR_PEP_ID=MMETSP1310-20130426/3812_1 /TAXON_ID=464262 /ORGANISM="Genus nov. species nov., Strain RCC2339" /LENGTH=170 /DNA_ID=CAMNT_0007113991 /DNA_START=30 /DNA_END=542 /DNA_ORIENTATION=-
MKAWYMNEEDGDQCAEHKCVPNKEVSSEELEKIGVLSYHVDGAEDEKFKTICLERGYTYQDEVCVSDENPNLAQMLHNFYQEHIHDDEEIRLCLEGSGYFDVRDQADKWVRVCLLPGDMIILPAGIYHRFTLDENRFIRARRMFVGEPVWTPHNRPCDDRPARKAYVDSL